jgi:hypothetical protein
MHVLVRGKYAPIRKEVSMHVLVRGKYAPIRKEVSMHVLVRGKYACISERYVCRGPNDERRTEGRPKGLLEARCPRWTRDCTHACVRQIHNITAVWMSKCSCHFQLKIVFSCGNLVSASLLVCILLSVCVLWRCILFSLYFFFGCTYEAVHVFVGATF